MVYKRLVEEQLLCAKTEDELMVLEKLADVKDYFIDIEDLEEFNLPTGMLMQGLYYHTQGGITEDYMLGKLTRIYKKEFLPKELRDLFE